MDRAATAERLTALLSLRNPPIALAFVGWDNDLDEACVHVIDQARYQQGGQRMPRYVDIDPHGRVRVFHSFATEICHRDLEESGQLLGVAGQATDPAVRVVQDR